MTGGAWERFWHPPATLRALALFRIAVAWLCVYDAFLYDPTQLLQNAEQVEPTWNPLVVFAALGVTTPPAALTAWTALAYQLTTLAVLLGWRTRTFCLLLALLAFWQGGVFYSLTKVRHDRVALCFATFALAFAPSGGAFAIDAWLRRRRGEPPPDAADAAWPIVLTRTTIAIGYCAAGLTKLLLVPAGWANGYTLQGIMIGHSGTGGAIASVVACLGLGIVAIAGELLCPLCPWFPRLVWVFLPLLFGFHVGTWTTMDTGPYMTLWFCWIAFVPLDRVPAWLAANRGQRALRTAAKLFAIAWLATALVVMVRVVPGPFAFAAAAATLVVAALERAVSAA